MMLFKIYYLKNELKPIRNINLRHYEYWCNGKWNIDHYGRDIMDIITFNLKQCYLKINTIENYEVNEFLQNQIHIFELNDEKYKRELLRGIVKSIVYN